jgi:hypothetical protein
MRLLQDAMATAVWQRDSRLKGDDARQQKQDGNRREVPPAFCMPHAVHCFDKRPGLTYD